MMLLALGVWAKQLTGSNTLAGLCTAVVMAPRLLGFLAGESLDRLPRRTALLGAELTTAGALAVLWLVQRDEQYVPLVIFGLVYGALGVLVYTASPGALKAITPKDEIPRAVSVLQVINGTVLLLGPISGTAVLATLGPRWLVVVTAGLFLIGALLLILVPIPRHDCGDVPGRWAGMRLLWSDPQLRVALVTLVMAYGVIGLVDGSLYALIDALHRPAQFAGVVLAAQGIGMVVGAFVVPGLIARRGSLRCLLWGILAAGISVVGIVVGVGVLLVALGCVALAGVSLSVALTSLGVLVQERVDQAVMGRAQAALQTAQTTPALATMILGALLVAHVDFRLLYMTAAGGLVAIGVWGLRRGGATRPERATPRAGRPG